MYPFVFIFLDLSGQGPDNINRVTPARKDAAEKKYFYLKLKYFATNFKSIYPDHILKFGLSRIRHGKKVKKKKKKISAPWGPQPAVRQNLVLDARYNKGGMRAAASRQDLGSSLGHSAPSTRLHKILHARLSYTISACSIVAAVHPKIPLTLSIQLLRSLPTFSIR